MRAFFSSIWLLLILSVGAPLAALPPGLTARRRVVQMGAGGAGAAEAIAGLA